MFSDYKKIEKAGLIMKLTREFNLFMQTLYDL
jgi:hypothetical protein